MDNYIALILAGGGGTRLWPMSRKHKPKQMLPLVGQSSMFQVSVERLAPLFTPDRIYISTRADYVDELRRECPDIPAENFIAEPSARNNAPAVGLALTIIQHRHPDAVIAMLTADHHIGKTAHFRNVLATAGEIAQRGKIVTLGISPTYPSTGFGYIEQGTPIGNKGGFDYLIAERFTEKPDFETASQFIASGNYSWNSGMFIWTAQKAMQEFQRQQPQMYDLFDQLQKTVDTPRYTDTLAKIWDDMPKVSIDYAIMEDAEDMIVIPVDIAWSDVGTWSSLYDILERDANGNCSNATEQQRLYIDTQNSLVFSDKLVVMLGIENVAVVETEDAILICQLNRSQEIKEVVQQLKQGHLKTYL